MGRGKYSSAMILSQSLHITTAVKKKGTEKEGNLRRLNSRVKTITEERWTGNVTNWHGSCMAQDRKAQNITGNHLKASVILVQEDVCICFHFFPLCSIKD